uniref:Coiled-coil domain containing 43 n=1 Tax=Astyanax mexicanus TaxID=7994 RepID=A0A3B1J0L7_ASTMX
INLYFFLRLGVQAPAVGPRCCVFSSGALGGRPTVAVRTPERQHGGPGGVRLVVGFSAGRAAGGPGCLRDLHLQPAGGGGERGRAPGGSESHPVRRADEVQAIASLIEKQAQIVVKQKEVPELDKKRKEALLAQYANVTDEEDEGEEEEELGAVGIPSEKSLFKNTNVEDVLNRRRQQREQAKEDSHKKKEQDKMQREKDKLSKQERKEKEKKRTQKGERKR